MMIGILGGGLSGLCTAYFLGRSDIEILEKENENGGLCKSHIEDGFTFDTGGSHILFSKDKVIMDIILKILKGKLFKRKRNTKIFYNGLYVKYPFENGLSMLPKQENFECLIGFLKVFNKVKKSNNLKEWFYNTFGEGIAKKYLIPYNEKIWNYPLDKMSCHWIERIPQPPMEDIVKSSLGIETEGYIHQLYFYYPKHGGISTLIKCLESKSDAKKTKNFDIKSIRKVNNKFVINDGERVYDKIISTLPLPVLFSCLENVPKKVIAAVNDLKYNSLICVMLGINKPNINDISWMYFPGNGWFNRLSFPFNFSQYVAPKGKSSVLAEITCYGKDNELWNMKDEKIIKNVIEDLEKMKIIKKKDVCFKNIKRTKFAYIIYDLNYDRNMKVISDYLNKIGIMRVGRFSEWSYLNMDAIIASAKSFAEKHKNM